MGLFFFAGHGIESQGRNYLIGKDSNLAQKDEIAYESLELNKVLTKMQNAGNRLNIVLLDACRNDPFSRSGGGGLAKSTARGTYIAYATSPGDVASDGNGKHGAFTSEILKHIDSPGISIERIFKRVKIGVINKTNEKQRPWISNDITGDFYFRLPSSKKQSKSSFNFHEEVTGFSLTVNPTPSSALVEITNINSKYHDGIRLKKGSYNVKVSMSGYKTKVGKIALQGDLNIDITLLTKKESSYGSSIDIKYLQDNVDTKKNALSFNEAMNYCSDLTLNGHKDWRLPTVEEWKSLDVKQFKYQNLSWYWSSSTDGAKIYAIRFLDGKIKQHDKNYTFNTRCIKN